jgi:plastocyanin
VPPTTSPVTVEPNGEVVDVLAVDNTFRPEETVIAAGTEVHWVNRGRNDHNIVPEDPDAAWRVDTEDFAPGDEASFVFTRAGTYRYYCSIHGTIDAGMPGVIIVE